MSMMGEITVPAYSPEFEWVAVRVKRKQVGGIGKVTVGGEFEAYRDKGGCIRRRRIEGTGMRVFLPEHILRRAGFEVFLPVKKVMKPRNRFSPERVCVSQPLLVDWMFVGWPVGESRWADLMALDVVVGVAGTGGHPVSVPERRVLRLMGQWGGGQLSAKFHQMVKGERLRQKLEAREAAAKLRAARARRDRDAREAADKRKKDAGLGAGDLARVIAGPMRGCDLRVVEVTGTSVRGLIELLGGDVSVEVRADMVAARKGGVDAP